MLYFFALLNIVCAFNPGGTASLAFSTVQEAKDTYMATILNIVNQIKLPDITIPNGSLSGNSFHVTDFPQNDLFEPKGNNSIQIQVTDVQA